MPNNNNSETYQLRIGQQRPQLKRLELPIGRRKLLRDNPIRFVVPRVRHQTSSKHLALITILAATSLSNFSCNLNYERPGLPVQRVEPLIVIGAQDSVAAAAAATTTTSTTTNWTTPIVKRTTTTTVSTTRITPNQRASIVTSNASEPAASATVRLSKFEAHAHDLHLGAKISLTLLAAAIALVAVATALDFQLICDNENEANILNGANNLAVHEMSQPSSNSSAGRGSSSSGGGGKRSNTWLASATRRAASSASALSLMSNSSSASSAYDERCAEAHKLDCSNGSHKTRLELSVGLHILLAFSLRRSWRQIFFQQLVARTSAVEHHAGPHAMKQAQDKNRAAKTGQKTTTTSDNAGQCVEVFGVESKIAAYNDDDDDDDDGSDRFVQHSRSLAANGHERRPECVDSLHGIKFLSMIWVIVIHSYDFALRWMYFSNSATLESVYKSFASQLLANGSFACDSFFFISGFLLSYLASPSKQQQQQQQQRIRKRRGRRRKIKVIRQSIGRNQERASAKSGHRAVFVRRCLGALSASAAEGRPKCCATAANDSKNDGTLERTRQRQQLCTGRVHVHTNEQQVNNNNNNCTTAVSNSNNIRAPFFPRTCLSQQPAVAKNSIWQLDTSKITTTTNNVATSERRDDEENKHDGDKGKRHAACFCCCCCCCCCCCDRQRRHNESEQSDKASDNEYDDEEEDEEEGEEYGERNCWQSDVARIFGNLLHRYIRMMPLMMVMIGLSATLLRYLGDGPQWDESTKMFDHWCRKNWWVNGLFLQNFINRENMCLGHSWYSAVDVQLFLFGQVILVVLIKKRRLGLILLVALMFGSQLLNATLTVWYHLPAVPLITSVSEQSMNMYFGEIYIKPYCRASPYLIGILLGYLLRTTSLAKRTLKKWQASVAWLCSLATIGAILVAMQPAMNGHRLTEWQAALYSSLSRPLWACALAWIIFACMTRQSVGLFKLIERLLSAKCFIPLSKLTYPAFLVHPIVMAMFYGSRQGSFHFSHYLMFYLILGNIVITYACAFVFAVLFELPLISIERTLSQHFWNRSSNCKSCCSSNAVGHI